MARCCLILGDQLSFRLPSLASLDPNDWVLMAEVWSEATYVKHHKQKIALVFSAMRHFAEALRARGRQVIYVTLDDPLNTQDLCEELLRHQGLHGFSHWSVTEPGEWRLKAAFEALRDRLAVPLDILEDTRFICSHGAFQAFLSGRKQPRLEHFYREMRKRTGCLMVDGKPVGGAWNFDQDNRKKFVGDGVPAPFRCAPDAITQAVLALVEERFADHFGSLAGFHWPVTEAEAEAALADFIAHRLPAFGDYQDALVFGEDTLFHSLISTSLNLGLLDPLDCCQAAEAAYQAGQAPINAVEGFIRQILGWREYVRGLYWATMPEYKTRNTLGADQPLPALYWDETRTDMRCMAEAIRNTREHAYAHHIQRLMVTGNFALLVGCSVEAVTDWYLAVYADAFEWVELPNTLGMALFADDGLMASKPYCASGKYIDRMSNYCKHCHYRVKEVIGERACPFNYLYWDFLIRHRTRFQSNPRMAMILKNLDRMPFAQQEAIVTEAQGLRVRLADSGSDQQMRQPVLL